MDIERRTKVSKLTPDNVGAIRQYAELLGAVEVTATTASFAGTPEEATRRFFEGQTEVGRRSPYGRRGGAYKALHAVGRKLRAQLGSAAAEGVFRPRPPQAGDPDAVDAIPPRPTPASPTVPERAATWLANFAAWKAERVQLFDEEGRGAIPRADSWHASDDTGCELADAAEGLVKDLVELYRNR